MGRTDQSRRLIKESRPKTNDKWQFIKIKSNETINARARARSLPLPFCPIYPSLVVPRAIAESQSNTFHEQIVSAYRAHPLFSSIFLFLCEQRSPSFCREVLDVVVVADGCHHHRLRQSPPISHYSRRHLAHFTCFATSNTKRNDSGQHWLRCPTSIAVALILTTSVRHPSIVECVPFRPHQITEELVGR